MGKSYSQDLREKVLGAVDNGMSKMGAHRVYQVSRSTIDDWLVLREQTGALTPMARRAPVKGRVLSGEAFVEFAQRHAGKRLEDMAVAWQQEQGQQVSVMSFWRALRCQGNVAPKGWTRKKRVGVTQSAAKKNGASSSKP